MLMRFGCDKNQINGQISNGGIKHVVRCGSSMFAVTEIRFRNQSQYCSARTASHQCRFIDGGIMCKFVQSKSNDSFLVCARHGDADINFHHVSHSHRSCLWCFGKLWLRLFIACSASNTLTFNTFSFLLLVYYCRGSQRFRIACDVNSEMLVHSIWIFIIIIYWWPIKVQNAQMAHIERLPCAIGLCFFFVSLVVLFFACKSIFFQFLCLSGVHKSHQQCP